MLMCEQTPKKPPDGPVPISPFFRHDSPVRKDRRHLPHWRLGGAFFYVTWRLHDSLPAEKLNAWYVERRAWLQEHPGPWDARTASEYRDRFPKQLEAWLDAGYGSCYFRRPACAHVVEGAFHFFDGERYDLASFVIMPNHVHALLQLRDGWKLEQVTHSLKGFSARKINQILNRRGALWQHEGFDHILRGVSQLSRCLSYIRNNPKVANLKSGEYLHFEAPGFDELL